MLSHDFYYGLIRKYVILFGSLFTDIYISRQDSSNNVVTSMQVPISYGPKEKFLARLLNDPTLSRPVAMVLPRMAFQITNMYYDANRKLPTINKSYSKDNDGTSGMSYIYNPVPYNFDIELYVMVKNQEDGTRILEQILPFFTPEWTSTINLISDTMNISRDIPIVLNSITTEDTYEGNFQDRRAIIWTLKFTLKGFLFGPIHTSKIIKKVIVNFYTPVDNYFTFNGSGTLTFNSNSEIVYGVGTDFTKEDGVGIGVGGKLYLTNGMFLGTTANVVNSSYLTMTANASITSTGETYRYTPNTVSNAARVERIEVYPGLTANGEPTSNALLSVDYSQINANDNYGYIVDFISDE